MPVRRVPFEEVKAGDRVFDAMGGTHILARARVLKSGALSIKRVDHPTEHIDNETRTITIVPKEG